MLDFVELLKYALSKTFGVVFSPTLEYHRNPYGIPFINSVHNLRLNGVPYTEWPDERKYLLFFL